jgi:hypothetical protein
LLTVWMTYSLFGLFMAGGPESRRRAVGSSRPRLDTPAGSHADPTREEKRDLVLSL